MKQRPLRGCLLLCIAALICSACICIVYAWDNEQRVTNSVYGTKTKMMTAELWKLERSENASETELPIEGAAFYLFKDNGTQIGGRYVTDENGKISVSVPAGNYYFEEILPSIGYTYDTDEDGNPITRYDFTVTEQEEIFVIKAYNVRLKGDLLIRKTIAGDEELSIEEEIRTFAFTVTFSDGGSYAYQIDDDEEETLLESGGTLFLCHGQTAVFKNIPIGVLYEVQEVPEEDYRCESMGNRGNITDQQSVAEFLNYQITDWEPSEETTSLNVTKALFGDFLESDREKEFEFELIVDGETVSNFTLQAGETIYFDDIPVGSVYQVREKDYYGEGFSQSVENGFGTATEEPIEVMVKNTYVGEIQVSIFGTKTWDLGAYVDTPLPENITIQLKNGDRLVEEKTVTPDENGLWNYEFTAPKYDGDGTEISYTVEELPVADYVTSYDGFNITNVYRKPVTTDPLVITKAVEGKNAPETTFDFLFEGESGAPMPEASENGRKYVTISGSGELEIGSITFSEPGVYHYSLSELNKAQKGWKYDTTVYSITYTVTEADHTLAYERIITKNDAQTTQLRFVNTYSEAQTETEVEIRGTKTWDHGKNPSASRPKSIIVYVYGNDKQVMQRLVTEKDQWSYSFTLPKYDTKGNRIRYTIDEAEVENYEKEVRGYDLINTYVEIIDEDDKEDVKDPEQDQKPGNAGSNGTDTGDYSRIGFWTLVEIFSGSGTVLTGRLRRKSEKKRYVRKKQRIRRWIRKQWRKIFG